MVFGIQFGKPRLDLFKIIQIYVKVWWVFIRKVERELFKFGIRKANFKEIPGMKKYETIRLAVKFP